MRTYMQITRISQYSGIARTRELDVTQEQLDARKGGMLAQQAFPGLSASDREFMMTGITDEEWEELDLDEEDWPKGTTADRDIPFQEYKQPDELVSLTDDPQAPYGKEGGNKP